jgi:hypothetical protein
MASIARRGAGRQRLDAEFARTTRLFHGDAWGDVVADSVEDFVEAGAGDGEAMVA